MKPTKDIEKFGDPKDDLKRITRLGRFLRNRGLDELPQLVNILLGQMVFIGPRAIPTTEYEKLLRHYPGKTTEINSWWNKRNEYKPALSGWHQVHLTDHNIIKHDLEYLRNPGLRKKLYIMVVSLAILIVGKNSYFKQQIPITYEYSIE